MTTVWTFTENTEHDVLRFMNAIYVMCKKVVYYLFVEQNYRDTKLETNRTWPMTEQPPRSNCISVLHSNRTKLNISNITREWTWIRMLAKNINIQEQKRFSASLTFYRTKYVTKLPYIFLPIHLLAHWQLKLHSQAAGLPDLAKKKSISSSKKFKLCYLVRVLSK